MPSIKTIRIERFGPLSIDGDLDTLMADIQENGVTVKPVVCITSGEISIVMGTRRIKCVQLLHERYPDDIRFQFVTCEVISRETAAGASIAYNPTALTPQQERALLIQLFTKLIESGELKGNNRYITETLSELFAPCGYRLSFRRYGTRTEIVAEKF